jgi:mono/diheme cytochrome c family protein
MTKRLGCVVAAAALFAAGCSSTSPNPPFQLFSGNMRQQPKYMPQGQSAFFADGRADRAPVPGTVARGDLKAGDAFYTGIQNGDYVVNPLPIDRQVLEHGQQRFNIYCSPCHDRTGQGKGIVAQRATWIAQNLTDARIRNMPDGQIFDTITHGKRTMPAYRYQISERDRWAIIAYVRALQRASIGTVADVPQELRSDLR